MCNQLSLNLEWDSKYQDKFRGAFIGASIGDALGFISEFMRSPSDIRTKYHMDKLNKLIQWERITTYTRRGQYIKLPLPAGTYSDDTQLTLATARSIEVNGSFNPITFSKFELPLWLEYELGGGSGTKAAARNLLNPNINWYNNFYHTSYNNYVEGGGNGAAMRILPIALINLTESSRRYLDIWRNTIITHGHPRALMGAILLADSISLLINKPPNKLNWLDNLIEICVNNYSKLINIWEEEKSFFTWKEKWNSISKQDFTTVWNNLCQETLEKLNFIRHDFSKNTLEINLKKLGCYDKKTKGAGDNTVIAAILFICRLTNFNDDSVGNEFEDTIVAIANVIGIDTDTIAYFAGAMIGVQYGIKAIPNDFKRKIQDYDYLVKVADWCYDIHLKSKNINKIFVYPESDNIKNLNQISPSLISYSKTNQYIDIPIFGNARVVQDINITPDWLDKRLHWLRLELEFGQTIFLKIERPSSVNTTNAQILTSEQEQLVVSSLPVLNEFKTRVEKSNFDSEVIVNILRELKFERKNRAIYNAFATWIWTALPQR